MSSDIVQNNTECSIDSPSPQQTSSTGDETLSPTRSSSIIKLLKLHKINNNNNISMASPTSPKSQLSSISSNNDTTITTQLPNSPDENISLSPVSKQTSLRNIIKTKLFKASQSFKESLSTRDLTKNDPLQAKKGEDDEIKSCNSDEIENLFPTSPLPVSPVSSPTNSSGRGSFSSGFSGGYSSGGGLFRRRIKRKFDSTNYMVVYEEVMNNNEAREVFRSYLKKVACNEEPMIFFDSLTKYRKDYLKCKHQILQLRNQMDESNCLELTTKYCKHVYELASSIINMFIKSASRMELNLGKSQAKILKYWCGEIEPIMIQFIRDLGTRRKGSIVSVSSESPKLSESPLYMPSSPSLKNSVLNRELSPLSFTPCEEPTVASYSDLIGVFNMMDTDKLFEKVVFAVELDLKGDQFPRFARSKELHDFLSKQGETFTRSIAIDISRGSNIDIRYKTKDFSKPTILDRDIYFAFTLSEDSSDWEPIKCSKVSNQSKLYHSTTSYSFGEDTEGMKLTKWSTTFPYPLSDVWSTFKHLSTIKVKGNAVLDLELVKYLPCGNYEGDPLNEEWTCGNNPLSLQYTKCIVDMKIPGVKQRDFPNTQSTIYDEVLDGYVNFGHTWKHPNYSPSKESVLYDGMFLFLLCRVDEKTTRLIHVVYADVHLPSQMTKLLATKIWKKRVASLEDMFLTVLRDKTKNSRRPFPEDELLDHFMYEKAVQDNKAKYPDRSWYQEYLTLVSNPIPQPSTPTNNCQQ